MILRIRQKILLTSILFLSLNPPVGINAQFGGIASMLSGLAPSLLGNAASGGTAGLLSGAAGAASGGVDGLLGNIGTLYQLAQGALQLTGTGVGILNQASEGRWFSSAMDGVMNNQRNIQDRFLETGNTDGLGKDYSQLGENFAAPDPSDYDGREEPPSISFPESSKSTENTDSGELIVIKSVTTTTTTEPTVESATIKLFPDEKASSVIDEREIPEMVNHSVDSGRAAAKSSKSFMLPNYDDIDTNNVDTKSNLSSYETYVKLNKMIKENNLTVDELKEIIKTVTNKELSSQSLKAFGDHDSDNSASVTNLQKSSTKNSWVTAPFPVIGVELNTEGDDSDLLPKTTPPTVKRARDRLFHKKIVVQRPKTSIIQQRRRFFGDAVMVTPLPHSRKFPRRTAYVPSQSTDAPIRIGDGRILRGTLTKRRLDHRERSQQNPVAGQTRDRFKMHSRPTYAVGMSSESGKSYQKSELSEKHTISSSTMLIRPPAVDSSNRRPSVHQFILPLNVLTRTYPKPTHWNGQSVQQRYIN